MKHPPTRGRRITQRERETGADYEREGERVRVIPKE